VPLAWLLHKVRRHRPHPRHEAAELPGGECFGAANVKLSTGEMRQLDEDNAFPLEIAP